MTSPDQTEPSNELIELLQVGNLAKLRGDDEAIVVSAMIESAMRHIVMTRGRTVAGNILTNEMAMVVTGQYPEQDAAPGFT